MNADKKKKIAELTREQVFLMAKSLKIAALPQPKRFNTVFKRTCKIMAIAFQIRNIELQKRIIISQPVPKFKKGGEVNYVKAIINDNRKPEIILNEIRNPKHR